MMARGLCRAAAVLLVATAWGRAWPVCLALWGWGDLVFRCTWPYISRCLGNHENPHLSLFGELRTPTSHAVGPIHRFSSVVCTDFGQFK